MLSLSDAHAAVTDLCPIDLDPVLGPDAVDRALARTARAATWTANTAYAEGTIVVPPIPAGRVYRCVLAGTSGPTEPPWLIAPPYTGAISPLAGAWWGIGAIPFVENVSSTPWFWGLADGTAAWRDNGPFAGELYDVRAAAAECWRSKARLAANRFKAAPTQGVSFDPTSVYRYCMEQAAALQPIRFA